MKEQMEKTQLELDSDNNNGEYKIEAIWDSTVYAKELEVHLLGLYYLVTIKAS